MIEGISRDGDWRGALFDGSQSGVTVQVTESPSTTITWSVEGFGSEMPDRRTGAGPWSATLGITAAVRGRTS